MLKNMKRVLALTLLLVALGGIVVPAVELTQWTTAVAEGDVAIMPFADIIDWRYTSINGRLHRRLYNYSRSVWIGEWEPC